MLSNLGQGFLMQNIQLQITEFNINYKVALEYDIIGMIVHWFEHPPRERKTLVPFFSRVMLKDFKIRFSQLPCLTQH